MRLARSLTRRKNGRRFYGGGGNVPSPWVSEQSHLCLETPSSTKTLVPSLPSFEPVGIRPAARDATVGVHEEFLRSEVLVALYLVQNTNYEVCEGSPGFLLQYARDIFRMNLQTEML